jgi:hypothetical protein
MAAARGESSFASPQKAVTNVNGQASGSRTGGALSQSSRQRRTARKARPIIIFFIHPPPSLQSRTHWFSLRLLPYSTELFRIRGSGREWRADRNRMFGNDRLNSAWPVAFGACGLPSKKSGAARG